MRWDNLRLDEPLGVGQESADGQALFPAGSRDVAVPLIERGAVARTFDAPGFRGMTFYEVQAKSVVNRVPEASRMPFRWTINPYRGCQHACVYCAEGETPILMANGRTKPLAEVRAGDEIYGTIRRGYYRRYASTTVLAHWSTVKPAYRVILEDGTQLISSGDHRFLTERGWKHVVGSESGPLRRPHLTVNNKLMGVGGFAEPPKETAAYRRGYLCGMIRGDGSVRNLPYQQPGRSPGHIYSFRLALTDQEGLTRTADYLSHVGIRCREFTFAEESATRRRMTAIRTYRRDEVRTIEWLIGWPETPILDWRKGFLAGMFDAEGSYSGGILRIPSTNPEIINWTVSSLQSLGFDFVLERRNLPNGLTYVRLRGGLKEALRFFHIVDPTITRKRSIEDVAIKSDARLRVVAVEPLGLDVPMYDITTGTGDFIANGVVSHNCFARNSHTYLDLDAGADFNTRVVVKVNAPQLVRKKMASPSWAGEHIAMGTNVDCYQRAEGRYQLMPGIIGALRDAANPFSILTKGTLILRDIELLAEAAEVTEVGLNVSAGFVDKDLWRSIEPGTPAPGRRLEACATLNGRGLRCGVLMGPVVPFLSDSPAHLDETVRQIAAAGARHVMPIVLHLRPGIREWFFRWLRTQHPGLVEAYLDLYGRGAYAPKAYQNRIAGQVRELAEKYGIGRPGSGSGRGTLPPRSVPAKHLGPAERPSAMLSSGAMLSPQVSIDSESLKSPQVTPQRRSPAPPEQLTLL